MTHTQPGNNEVKSGFALVNGLNLYYEIHGSGGEALVLLHGGVGGIEMFGPNLAALAATRCVIGVNLRGHGYSADVNRPLSFELMADDIAALIRHLGLEHADIMGYSLGGGVALQTAIRHPQVVRKLVVISAPTRQAGWYPEVLQGMAQLGPEAAASMKFSPLSRLYPQADWASLFTKLGNLLRQEYDWSSAVAALKQPLMIAFADADAVSTAHIMEFFGLLGGGRKDAGLDGTGRPAVRLAILPGVTHYDILFTPTLAALAAPFLDVPMPDAGI